MHYNGVEGVFYRWVKSKNTNDQFVPLNILKDPPLRILEDADKACKGYGLSIFNTEDNGERRFIREYEKKRVTSEKRKFANIFDSVAAVNLTDDDGLAGDLNIKTGHLTFHPYINVNLNAKISKIKKVVLK